MPPPNGRGSLQGALRAPWSDRARWAAAFFVASTAVSQGWKAVMTLRYGDATGLRPSGAFLLVALALVVLLVPAPWKRWLVVAAIPLLAIGVVLGAASTRTDAQTLAQSPPTSVFLFRAFEIDPIIFPDNGRDEEACKSRRTAPPPAGAVPFLRCHARGRFLVRERSDLR